MHSRSAAANTSAAAAAPPPPRVANLSCPYAERDQAKALGAKWDPAGKTWYVPPGLSLHIFARWSPVPVGSSAPAPPPAAPPPPRASTSSSAASTSASAGIEAGELALFTDGACKGNQNVATSNLSAGWGVCVVSGIPAGTTVGGTVEAERYGQVELNRQSGLFLGAEVGSNNTGELTGVCEALHYLIETAASTSSAPPPPPACICYDSNYAANQTEGKWKVNKNKELVRTAQSLLAQARRKRSVRFLHVKGHSGHQWNERADQLANLGETGQRSALPQRGGGGSAAAKRSADDNGEHDSSKRSRPAPAPVSGGGGGGSSSSSGNNGGGAAMSMVEKAELVGRNLGIAPGTPIPGIVQEASDMLGLNTAGLMPLGERLDAVYWKLFQ